MKKFLLAVISMFTMATANAATSGIEDVQPKGGFALGVQIGIPPVGDAWDANMPMVSVDGNWTLTSGMFNAGKFGQNGAIDLGFYYGACHYTQEWGNRWYSGENGLFQNAVLVRSAFHFEFVPKLDVYAGVFGGVNIWVPTKDSEWDTDVKGCFGMKLGGKYYFTDKFGVKLEFADDFIEGNYPNVAAGISLKF